MFWKYNIVQVCYMLSLRWTLPGHAYIWWYGVGPDTPGETIES